MDSFKLTGKTEKEFIKHLHRNKFCSDNIRKEFGNDKCAEILLKEEKLVLSQN
jgi:hypothetical protein